MTLNFVLTQLPLTITPAGMDVGGTEMAVAVEFCRKITQMGLAVDAAFGLLIWQAKKVEDPDPSSVR